MRVYQDSLTNLFRIFVKDANARNDVLKWIGDCFDENYGRKLIVNDFYKNQVFVL